MYVRMYMCLHMHVYVCGDSVCNMPIFLDELCSVLAVSVQWVIFCGWCLPSVAPETIAYYFGLQFKKQLIGFAFRFVSVTLPGFLCMGGMDGGQG